MAHSRYGIGVQHTTHWSVPFIAEGFLYFGLASVPAITMTYGMIPHSPALTSSHRFVLSGCIRGVGPYLRSQKRICLWLFLWGCPLDPWLGISGRVRRDGCYPIWRHVARHSALVLWKEIETHFGRVEGYQLVVISRI